MNNDTYFCPFCGGQEIEIIEHERPKHKLLPDPRKIEIICPQGKQCVLTYLFKLIN
jgi:hypothetical protein